MKHQYDKTISVKQQYEKTISMKRQYEKTISMKRQYEKTISMKRQYEKTISVKRQYEKTISMKRQYDKTISMKQHTTVATYARSSAFTGRIASRTRRFIAAVDVTPSAKTLNRRDGVCSNTCYACHGTHPLSKRSTTISPTQETPHSEGVHERLRLPR